MSPRLHQCHNFTGLAWRCVDWVQQMRHYRIVCTVYSNGQRKFFFSFFLFVFCVLVIEWKNVSTWLCLFPGKVRYSREHWWEGPTRGTSKYAHLLNAIVLGNCNQTTHQPSSSSVMIKYTKWGLLRRLFKVEVGQVGSIY